MSDACQTHCLVLQSFLEEVTNESCVSEILVLICNSIGKVCRNKRFRFDTKCIFVLLQITLEDFKQLICIVIWEVNVPIEARLETRIGIYEGQHLISISCKNHNQSLTVIFHSLQECRDGFRTIVIITTIDKRVCFIYKQYTIEGRINDFIRLYSCLTNVFCYKSRTVSFNQMSFLDYSKFAIDISKDSCNGCFASTRVAGEYTMIRNLTNRQSLLFPQLLYLDEISKPFYFCLYRRQSDQTIQLVLRIHYYFIFGRTIPCIGFHNCILAKDFIKFF